MSDQVIVIAALLVAGYILMAVETLVIPGFGFAGVGGLAALGAGCALAFQWFGVMYGSVAVVLVVGTATVFLIWIPKTRFGSDVIQKETLAEAKASVVAVETGATGVAETDLRPAGIGRFADARVNIVTDGDFISVGAPIQVVEIEGNRVVVEVVTTPDSNEEESAAAPRGGN